MITVTFTVVQARMQYFVQEEIVSLFFTFEIRSNKIPLDDFKCLHDKNISKTFLKQTSITFHRTNIPNLSLIEHREVVQTLVVRFTHTYLFMKMTIFCS